MVWFWGEAAAAAAAVAVSAPPGAVIVPASASATIAVRAAAAAAKTAGAATSAPAAKAAATSASAATVAAAVASSATAAGAAVAAVATGAASASATGAVVGTIPSAVGAAAAATGAAVGRTTTGATSAAATTASPVGTTLALPLQLTSVGNVLRPGFDSIFIGKSFVGVTLVMGLSATDTALSMRRKVATRIATMQLPRRRGGGGGLSEDRFRLVWSGKAVDSGSSLMSLGIQPNHTLEAVFYHAAGVGSQKEVRTSPVQTLVIRMLRENVGCRCNGVAKCISYIYPHGQVVAGTSVFEPQSRPAKVLVGAFCEVVFRENTFRMFSVKDREQKMAKDFWQTLQISPGHPKCTPSTATDFFRCYVDAVEKETGVTFTEPPFFKEVFVAHMGMTPDKRSMFFDHYEAGDNQTNVNNLQIRRHIHEKLCNMSLREVPWKWETLAIRHSLQRALNFPRVPLLPKFVCERAAGVPKEQSIFIDGAFCSYFCQNCSQPGATVAPPAAAAGAAAARVNIKKQRRKNRVAEWEKWLKFESGSCCDTHNAAIIADACQISSRKGCPMYAISALHCDDQFHVKCGFTMLFPGCKTMVGKLKQFVDIMLI